VFSFKKKYSQTPCTSRFHLESFSVTPFEFTKFPRVGETQLSSNSKNYRDKTVRFTDWQPASFSLANHIILTRPDNALFSTNVSRPPDCRTLNTKVHSHNWLPEQLTIFWHRWLILKAHEGKKIINTPKIHLFKIKKLLIYLFWHLIFIYSDINI